MKPPERFPPDDLHNASGFFTVPESPEGALTMKETRRNAHVRLIGRWGVSAEAMANLAPPRIGSGCRKTHPTGYQAPIC